MKGKGKEETREGKRRGSEGEGWKEGRIGKWFKGENHNKLPLPPMRSAFRPLSVQSSESCR